jgi:hypothetical protein
MEKSVELRSSSGVAIRNENLAGVVALAALLFLLGAGDNRLAAQNSVNGAASSEQNSEDSVSATTDATMSGDTSDGDCRVSAHASASSTSNGETVSRQSEKHVEGPCGKASAKASASSSDSSKGASNNDD